MAEKKRTSKRTAAILFGAAAAGLAAGLVAERAYVRRDRARPDPEAGEPFGEIRGETVEGVFSADGTALHVEQWGTGPAIVLAHGFSLNLTSWHYQIIDLGRDQRVVAYDQRGHGRSGRPPDGRWGLDALAEDLDAVVRAAGPGPVVVMGHSMGGMAILEFASRFPEAIGSRVAAIVLVDTTSADVLGGIVPGVGRYVQATIQGLQEAAMRAVASNAGHVETIRGRAANIQYIGTRFMGFGPRPSPSKVGFVERMLSETPADVAVSLIPTLTAMDVSGVLETIDVPALIVVGTHDRLTPPGAARRLSQAVKDSELHVIRGAGHMAMLEKPEEFNERLRRFLERVPGRR